MCQCDTQILQLLCCCCEHFVVQQVKYGGGLNLFSNVHNLTFFVLKCISQHCPQRLSASKSCWRSSWSCSESIDIYTKQSLANKRTAVPGSKTLGRSLMNNRKSSGPNTVLWGTFESTESTKWAPSILLPHSVTGK